MIGQFKGRQKTNVYGWVSDLAVARSGFNQIGNICNRLSEINTQAYNVKTSVILRNLRCFFKIGCVCKISLWGSKNILSIQSNKDTLPFW